MSVFALLSVLFLLVFPVILHFPLLLFSLLFLWLVFLFNWNISAAWSPLNPKVLEYVRCSCCPLCFPLFSKFPNPFLPFFAYPYIPPSFRLLFICSFPHPLFVCVLLLMTWPFQPSPPLHFSCILQSQCCRSAWIPAGAYTRSGWRWEKGRRTPGVFLEWLCCRLQIGPSPHVTSPLTSLWPMFLSHRDDTTGHAQWSLDPTWLRSTEELY